MQWNDYYQILQIIKGNVKYSILVNLYELGFAKKKYIDVETRFSNHTRLRH